MISHPPQWNGHPQATEHETDVWYSPELEIELLDKTFDPDAGNVVIEVTQLEQTEPDPALFTIPADYQVAEQDAPAPVDHAIVLSHPDPEFSEEARREKISGNVLVGLTVDVNGLPVNVRVIRGIGHGLDEKAVEAVKQYRFRPAMAEGKPVATQLRIEVNFQIFVRRN